MPRMTGAEAIVKSLLQRGVDTVFALPGGQLDHLFDAMYKEGDKLRVYHSRHEQGVAYMAYGYAKSTGRVGVYGVVPGPGLLNSSAALCTAWANSAPVLCISGQIPSASIGKGYGELHEIPDQLGMIRHITKWAERIGHPGDAPAIINQAFQQLCCGRPQPVEIEMPMDVMGMEAMVDLLEPTACGQPPLPGTAIDAAARALATAGKPVIMIGSGAAGAAAEVLALAEYLQAPVGAKRSGKGIVPGDHYLSANLPLAHEYWGEADVVLAIGTRLREPLTMWGRDPALKLVRVDIDAVEMNRICEPDIAVLADARAATSALLEAVSGRRRSAGSRRAELEQRRAAMEQRIRSQIRPQMAFLDVIRGVLPRDGIFVDEITQVGFASWLGFPVYGYGQHISASEMGTLGYGLPTALGAAVGNPDRKVVQISGDGGFMFNVQELASAVQHQIDLVTIIFNDNKFGNVQRQQDEWFGGRRICSDLHNPDFAKLAETFGATGLHAGDPEELRQALTRGLEIPGPVLIEVPVRDAMPSPWQFIVLPQNRQYLCP